MAENSVKLTIVFPDGTRIQEKKPTDTFISALCRLGLEKVNETGYMANAKRGILLVGKTNEAPDRTTQKDGWFIYKSFGVSKMADILDELSAQLNAGLTVNGGPGTRQYLQLKVVFPDGSVIQEERPTDSFTSALSRLGLEQVNETGYLARDKRGILLVERVNRDPGRTSLIDGWYVYRSFDVQRMMKILSEVSKQLNAGIEVEVTKKKG